MTDDHVKHEVRSSSKHTLPHSVIVADVITFDGFSSMICSLPALFSLFWEPHEIITKCIVTLKNDHLLSMFYRMGQNRF